MYKTWTGRDNHPMMYLFRLRIDHSLQQRTWKAATNKEVMTSQERNASVSRWQEFCSVRSISGISKWETNTQRWTNGPRKIFHHEFLTKNNGPRRHKQQRERKCHAAFTARFPESNSLIARLGGSSGELCEHHFLCTVEVCYSDTLGNGQKVSL